MTLFGKSRAARFILKRYLLSSWMAKRTRSRSTIGVFLPMLGVAVGVAAFVVVLSIMAGFVRNLESRLLAVDSHIEVVVKDSFGFIPQDSELLQDILKSHSSILAVSPFQRGDAILQSSARASTVVLWGVQPEGARRSSDLESKTLFSNLLMLNENAVPTNIEPSSSFPSIIVGGKILSHIAADVGHRLTLVSITAEEGPAGLAPIQFPVVVADELRSGNPAFDGKVVIGNLDFVARFFGTEGYWAGVQVRVKDLLEMNGVVEAINKKFASKGLRAKPWTEANKAFVRALTLERWAMKFVMFVVILVACFSITITLVLAVRRKAREMAILRSLGIQRKELGAIFLLHGMGIGVIGVAAGLSLAFLILQLVRGNVLGFLTIGYSAGPLPVYVNWPDVFLVSIGSVILAMVASLWPAYEVMRIDVVETISERGGFS